MRTEKRRANAEIGAPSASKRRRLFRDDAFYTQQTHEKPDAEEANPKQQAPAVPNPYKKKRLLEKKAEKFSSVPINSANDGFSMLKTKDMTHYALLVANTSVKE